jgi:hypothetical protein
MKSYFNSLFSVSFLSAFFIAGSVFADGGPYVATNGDRLLLVSATDHSGQISLGLSYKQREKHTKIALEGVKAALRLECENLEGSLVGDILSKEIDKSHAVVTIFGVQMCRL